MVGATKLPNSSYTSSIDEAQALVRQCAEPRPAGDLVKSAIRRAAQLLDMPFARTRDIWYGDARRVDADEMDHLRRAAERAELAQFLAVIEGLKTRLRTSPCPTTLRAIANLTAAQHAIQRSL
jgi:hypothetical protein